MFSLIRPPAAAQALADRLCRPQRIGVFGHRGVGKTTLLTMLYREAVGGRLPDLRLAAADARTADYLSDKILPLERGEALPGTLAATDLRFPLYHTGARPRPMALVLTKADRLTAGAADPDAFAAERLGMTRHALRAHAPRHGSFAVSSLGPDWPAALEPCGLDAPLAWLAEALRAQDEA